MSALRHRQGLETLVRRKCPRVSVVSEGAEVIFISKKLFLQEANIRVLRIVNDMVGFCSLAEGYG